MALPELSDGTVVTEDHWNAHVTEINRLLDKPYARYTIPEGSTQTIPTSEDAKVQFNTAVHTHPEITTSGTGNQDITLNRSGVWAIDTALRWESTNGEGERAVSIADSSSFTSRYSGQSVYSAGAVCDIGTGTVRRFSAGTTLSVICWQSSGGPADIVALFNEATFVSLVWLAP